MRMMKRILCAALICCLLTASALAEGANRSLYQEPLDYTQVEDYSKIKRAQSFVGLNGVLYVLTQTTLEKWTPDMAEPEVLAVTNPVDTQTQTLAEQAAETQNLNVSILFTMDGAVYAIAPMTGQVYLAVDASGACVMTPGVVLEGLGIRTTPEDDYGYLPEIMSVCVSGGKLYLLQRDYMTGDYNRPDLLCFDLTTGKSAKVDAQFVKGMCAYKDGGLLLLVQDEEHSWDEATQQTIPPTLSVYDAATGAVTKLFDFEQNGVYGMAYSETANALYYCGASRVYCLPGMAQPATLAAYLTSSSWAQSSGALLSDTLYATQDTSGLCVREMTPGGISTDVLTVYGEYGSNQHLSFALEHPEIPVTLNEEYYEDMEALTNAIVSGEDAVDVLCLDSNYSPLDRLIDKGYAMDLSGYPELVQIVEEMYPAYADYVKRDGKLYGIPYRVSGESFCFNREAWEEIGLSEADYPATYMELLDFIANWEYDYADDYPDVKLFDDTSIKYTLLDMILGNYVTLAIQQGETLTFDTPLLRKLLSKLEEIDFTALEPESESDSEMEDYWNRTSLMIPRMGVQDVSGFSSENGYQYRVLALDEGVSPCVACNLSVMIINPRTPRAEQAVRYAITYVNNLDRTGGYLTLFPDHNEPVLNAGYETSLQRWRDELARTQELLANAAPEDAAGYQDTINWLQTMLDNPDSYKYYTSPEDIAFYRKKLAPYLVVTGKTPLNTWDNEGNNDLYTQIEQYLAGAIDQEQFIKAIEQRVRMMQLEAQ